MIHLKLNVPLQGHKVGDVLTLATDSDGIILDEFWFRRLQDSRIDNCVEIINDTTTEDKPSKGSI